MKKSPTSPHLKGVFGSRLGGSLPGDSEKECVLGCAVFSRHVRFSRATFRIALQTEVFEFRYRPERHLGEADRLG